MRKVLFVITKSNWGGAQHYVYDLATHMPAGTEVIVACGPAQDSAREGELIIKLRDAGVRSVFVPALTRDMSIADIGAFRSLKKLFDDEKPDVVHLNSSKAGGLGALAARASGVPRIVFTAHGWAFRESRPFFVRALMWLASLATVALSHQVICVTKPDRNAFVWLFPRRMHLIHNALPAPLPLKTRTEARHAIAPEAPPNCRWIGSIGELTRNKGFDIGLRAFAHARNINPNLFYCIIGDGRERTALEALADELAIREHVCFAGAREDASAYLSAFDVFFIPSRKEGLPYAMLEAHAAGLPVVASFVGGIPEIRGPADTLCPSGDVGAFAHALTEVPQTAPPITTDFMAMRDATIALYV
jgi:glycosyltransferase involved in cell wall biosynthesis